MVNYDEDSELMEQSDVKEKEEAAKGLMSKS